MKTTAFACRGLHVEPLEARTLFTGGLLSGDSDLSEATAAVSGTGEFSMIFDSYFGNTMTIRGSGDVALTINFDQLPDNITRITLASFDQVNLIGSEHLDTLTVKDIAAVAGAGMTIGNLKTQNVGEVTLAGTTASTASFAGGTTRVAIGDIDGTMLISAVDTLKILSESEQVYVMFTRQDQTVEFEYLPKHVDATGDHDWNRQMLFPVTGPSEPGEPGKPGDPEPEPKVVVVFHLADEAKIKSLLNQLENNQRLATLDPEQLLLALEKIETPNSTSVGVDAADKGVDRVRYALTEEKPTVSSRAFSELAPLDAVLPTLGDLELAERHEPATDGLAPPRFKDVPPVVVASAQELVRQVELAVTEKSGTNGQQPTAEELYGLYVFHLDQEARSLGDYLLDRFSAELVPGNQTAVLLIDPKPNRLGGNSQRESLFDVVSEEPEIRRVTRRGAGCPGRIQPRFHSERPKIRALPAGLNGLRAVVIALCD